VCVYVCVRVCALWGVDHILIAASLLTLVLQIKV
jgi:hypothetical protein